MTEPLTEREQRVYEVLCELSAQKNDRPSLAEIGAETGWSKSVVRGLRNKLREKGWIEFDARTARSIRLVQPPPGGQRVRMKEVLVMRYSGDGPAPRGMQRLCENIAKVAGAAMVLALPEGMSIESLDEERMAELGWTKKEKTE